MKLTRKLEIGINVVNVLKASSGLVRVSDMATKVDTTVSFLEQVMRKLKTAGIVTVKRGPGGGYTLSKTFGDVNAFHVAQAVSGTTTFGVVKFDETPGPVSRLRQSIVDAFSSTVI